MSQAMSLSNVSISGYIIRLRYPTQERLRTLRVYSSDSDVLAKVADELAPILLEIDGKYAKREIGRKSRNFRASLRYSEVEEGDTKVLRVIPYPSSFINMLSNIRRDIYAVLKRYCVPIINMHDRYIYATPANMLEKIAEEVDKINRRLSELRMRIEAFDMSWDRAMIEERLSQLGIKYEFRVPNITDVRIVTLRLSLTPEIASELIGEYARANIDVAIDQVVSEIASNIKDEVIPIIKRIKRRRGLKKVREDLEILDKKLRGLGLDEIADEIAPLMDVATSEEGEIKSAIDDIAESVIEGLSKYEVSEEDEFEV